MLPTPESIRTLQRKLYLKAKQEPGRRFHSLYDKIYRADILGHAYNLVRANKGSAGIDGVTFKDIEEREGKTAFLAELCEALKDKTYKPAPVKRVMIPKANGSQRPLGIPTIRDRVAQMAAKLVIEPIFEADFCQCSYGFRPRKSAHDAIDDVTHTLNKGYTEVIDADLSKYFDTIPHSNLMATVAERICDGAVLHLIQLWLKAPVMEEDKDGTKRIIGGGGSNRKGTPQGGVMTPRTQKVTWRRRGPKNFGRWIISLRNRNRVFDPDCLPVNQNLFHNQTQDLLSFFDVKGFRCAAKPFKEAFHCFSDAEKSALVNGCSLKGLQLCMQSFYSLSQLRHPFTQLIELKKVFLISIQKLFDGLLNPCYFLAQHIFFPHGRIRLLNLLQPPLYFIADEIRVFK